MSSSLDSLVNNLKRGGNDFFGFEDYSENQYKLLIRKGIYPYKCMDDWDKFEETKLPPKEAFYSKLNMAGVNEGDYKQARRVWVEFGLKDLREYYDLYLKTDVILQANVFEAFSSLCLDNYGLDPAHFYTAPGLAWKACLKKTKIRLELLLDPDMLLMFERGIRGGITQSINRWAKANNPYMGSEYKLCEPTKYLQYLDANNLYGWAMSQPLPTGGFKWVDVKPDEISKLTNAKDKRYLLEVDVRYPRELHDYHNDLPFMCEPMAINGVEKLVPNLYYKKRYVIHIRALEQTVKHGLVLERIHKAIEFKQSAWMKEYIDLNTKLRTAAANDFEKGFYKLMNNAVFGKTMENIRKHRKIKLLTNREVYLRAVMKPNFKSGVRFDENLMGCEMGKIKVVMNKPVYLGQAILDFSKIVMYEFHYDYMKKKYDDKNLTLCCMDTDSLIYSIETDNFYKDIADDVKDRFDTSGYNPNRPLPVGLNKKVIGLMKDELGGEIMTEFVTLRSKMYAYKTGTAESKKCKGIKKCVVRKTTSFEDYKNCLLSGETSYRSQLMFRSSKHEVRTLEVNKLALSRDDDKRITANGINSLARGHYKVVKNNLYIYKMEPLTIETFNPDMIKAINSEQKKAGDINYTSVKFEYGEGKIPPLRIDGKFRLFRFKNSKGDIHSLSIKCNEANERFFERLCEVVSRESCRLVPKVNGRKLKPEEFELVKDSKVWRNVYAKIYTRKSGKVKCRVSLKCPKNTIQIDELVEENFEGSCILRLYHAYLGSTESITLSVEEILVKEMDTIKIL